MGKARFVAMATVSLLLAANAANTLVWANSHGGHQGQGNGQGKGQGHGASTSPVVSVSAPHGGHEGKQKVHPQSKPEPKRQVVGENGGMLEGVVEKVYGSVAKLNAYESITLGTGISKGHTGEKGKKGEHAKANKPVHPHKDAAAATRDLRSAAHLLSAAVKQLEVTVTNATYGSGTVTGSTYGTTPDWVGTIQGVETALTSDAAAVNGLSTGGDAPSIITDLTSQISTLQRIQGSLPAATEDREANRKKKG